jgi:hypothetical protein
VKTGNMWLVYEDDKGDKHHQPWQDLVEAGTLIDPYSGDDMEMIGWTTEI